MCVCVCLSMSVQTYFTYSSGGDTSYGEVCEHRNWALFTPCSIFSGIDCVETLVHSRVHSCTPSTSPLHAQNNSLSRYLRHALTVRRYFNALSQLQFVGNLLRIFVLGDFLKPLPHSSLLVSMRRYERVCHSLHVVRCYTLPYLVDINWMGK